MENLDQGTQEWLEWRCSGIGASDAPAIMGKSLYKTKLELWNEKFNKIIEQDESKEFIFNKGHRIEAWARPGIEFETGMPWRPALFTHKTFEFIRASLDGWQPQILEAWECKFMGKDLWATLADESLTIEQRIPPQYYDQIMQQFFVTGAKAVRLTGVKEEKIDDVKTNKAYTLRIERTPEHEEYINKVLAPKLFEFWKSVQDGIAPEADKKDVLKTDDGELKELVFTYGNLVSQEKQLKEKVKKETEKILGDIPEQVKKIKSQIEGHASRNHGKMDIEGYKLTEKRGKEIVDYKAAFEAFVGWINNLKETKNPGLIFENVTNFPDEPSLEKYTTAGKPSFVITIPKPKEEKTENKGIDFAKRTEKETATEQLKESLNNISPEVSEAAKPAIERVEQIVQDDKNEKLILDWKNPLTGKMPRGWKTKSNEDRLKYLKKEIKKATEEQKIQFNDIMELLDPTTRTQQEGSETIGGITFEA